MVLPRDVVYLTDQDKSDIADLTAERVVQRLMAMTPPTSEGNALTVEGGDQNIDPADHEQTK